MDCLKKYDYISFLDNTLSLSEREDYEIHFGVCHECKETLLCIQHSMEIINRQKEIKANPFLFTRIREKMNIYEKVSLRIRILKPVVVSGIALFALIIGMTLGYYLTNMNSSQSNINSMVWNELDHENIEMAFLKE
jgi:hypothetical protein